MTRRLWAVETCVEDGCDRPPLARSLCGMHYQRRRLRGEELPPKVRVPLAGVVCAVDGCADRAVARGLCTAHRARERRYGLSAADMAALTGAACDVCGRPGQHVDHDHATGAVRGLLCRACNTALGMVEDDPDRLYALILYLDRADAARDD